MADHESEFESVESGASDKYPMQCSSLRKNGFCMIKGRPCKIVEMSTSKTGKHGHAKVHMVGIDIFNGKKYEDICPSTHNMDVPNVQRLEYQVLSFEDDFFSLMDDQGDVREDLKIGDSCSLKSDEVTKLLASAEESEETVYATVWKAVGMEQVKELKSKASN